MMTDNRQKPVKIPHPEHPCLFEQKDRKNLSKNGTKVSRYSIINIFDSSQNTHHFHMKVHKAKNRVILGVQHCIILYAKRYCFYILMLTGL